MDPVTIAAGVAAFKAAQSSITAIREALDTANDISSISHHISDLFHHSREANKAYQAQRAHKEGVEKGEIKPDESLQEAIDLMIHRREMSEMIKDLEYELNKKFPTPEGEPTMWQQIKREQSRIQALKIKQKRERAEIAKREAEEAKERWKKIGIEALKFGFLIIVTMGIGWMLLTAYDTGPIRQGDMELTASHAIQGIMVLATIAGGYAVVKSNLARVMEDLERHIKKSETDWTKFDARLDAAEEERGRHQLQITTLKDINSPAELKAVNREMADIGARLKTIEKQLERLQNMHNGNHP